MGETAENVAEQRGISRQDQDRYALESQRRYAAALAAGHFADELLAVQAPAAKGQPVTITADEHPRQTSLEKLAELKPSFRQNGTVTAGNAAGLNDGAAMTLLASAAAAQAAGARPLAYVRAFAVARGRPAGDGPGPYPSHTQATCPNRACAWQTLTCLRLTRPLPPKYWLASASCA